MKARKTVLFLFALLEVSIILAQFAKEEWIAVGLISLAVAAHQAWATNYLPWPLICFLQKQLVQWLALLVWRGQLEASYFQY